MYKSLISQQPTTNGSHEVGQKDLSNDYDDPWLNESQPPRESSKANKEIVYEKKNSVAGGKTTEHAERELEKAHQETNEAILKEEQLNSFHSKVSINDCKYEQDSMILETHRSQ